MKDIIIHYFYRYEDEEEIECTFDVDELRDLEDTLELWSNESTTGEIKGHIYVEDELPLRAEAIWNINGYELELEVDMKIVDNKIYFEIY